MNWLSYTLPDSTVVDAARIVCIFLGVICAVFSFYYWRALGTDRALVYLLIGALAVLLEWQQLDTHARFLVWRLPLITLLVLVALWAERGYIVKRHTLDAPRGR